MYRSLISYFTKNPDSRLADLDLEDSGLSCCGVIEFLDTLSMLEKPLKFLSVADNALGRYSSSYKHFFTLYRFEICLALKIFLFFSEIAEAIVNSLTISIESLNISGIGLGPLGFLALGRKLEKGLKKLLSINIRFKANPYPLFSVYVACLQCPHSFCGLLL